MKGHSPGEFEELVLLLVAADNPEAYGVMMSEKLKAMRDKKYYISAVHMVVKCMENTGFADSKFGAVTSKKGGRRKKYYSITSPGKKVFDCQHEVRSGIYKQIPDISFGQ
jgi:DNA-binding PadR family transcriptional regulator